MEDHVQPDHPKRWVRDGAPIPFMAHVGPVFRCKLKGVHEYGFKPTQDVDPNLQGNLHDEMILAFTGYEPGHSCSVDFVRRTRALSFIRGEIKARGQLLAVANGIWKVFSNRNVQI
jgi:hypothetical protein